MTKLEKELTIKWESLNFLTEQIDSAVLDLLWDSKEELPKNAKIKIFLEFKETQTLDSK